MTHPMDHEQDPTMSISEQAAHWWVLLHSEGASATDHLEFGEWVARSPERVESYLQTGTQIAHRALARHAAGGVDSRSKGVAAGCTTTAQQHAAPLAIGTLSRNTSRSYRGFTRGRSKAESPVCAAIAVGHCGRTSDCCRLSLADADGSAGVYH
jgi:ferric-dicitrate binding protein FerR (iron transport regulator)